MPIIALNIIAESNDINKTASHAKANHLYKDL